MNRSILKKIAGFSIPTFISAGISFISTPIITRVFETAEVGKINLFITYLSLIAAFCYMGLDQSFVRFYNEPQKNESRKSLLATCLKFSLIIAVFLSLLLLMCRNTVSSLISGEKNNVISILLILALFGTIINRYMQLNSRMEENILKYSVQAVGYTLVVKIACIFAAFRSPTHLNAINIIAVGCFIIGIAFIIIEKEKVDWSAKVRRETTIEIWKYGFPLMPGAILMILNNSISQIVLSRVMDYSMVGIYSSAISIASLVSLIQSGFNTYWAAYVWKNYQTDQSGIQKMHHIITFVMTLFGIFIIVMQDIVFLILGADFRGGRYVFAYLLISPICYTISETTGLGIGISKKSYFNTIITVVTLGLNIALLCILIPRIGLRGAAISSAITGVLFLFLRTIIGERYYKCVSNKRNTVLSLILLIFLAICSDVFTINILERILCSVCAFIVLMVNYRKMIFLVYKKFIRKSNH